MSQEPSPQVPTPQTHHCLRLALCRHPAPSLCWPLGHSVPRAPSFRFSACLCWPLAADTPSQLFQGGPSSPLASCLLGPPCPSHLSGTRNRHACAWGTGLPASPAPQRLGAGSLLRRLCPLPHTGTISKSPCGKLCATRPSTAGDNPVLPLPLQRPSRALACAPVFGSHRFSAYLSRIFP